MEVIMEDEGCNRKKDERIKEKKEGVEGIKR
jgi:hypothetical protein